MYNINKRINVRSTKNLSKYFTKLYNDVKIQNKKSFKFLKKQMWLFCLSLFIFFDIFEVAFRVKCVLGFRHIMFQL